MRDGPIKPKHKSICGFYRVPRGHLAITGHTHQWFTHRQNGPRGNSVAVIVAAIVSSSSSLTFMSSAGCADVFRATLHISPPGPMWMQRRSGVEFHPSHFRVSAVVKIADMKYRRWFSGNLGWMDGMDGFSELLKINWKARDKGQLLR